MIFIDLIALLQAIDKSLATLKFTVAWMVQHPLDASGFAFEICSALHRTEILFHFIKLLNLLDFLTSQLIFPGQQHI